MSDWKDKLTEKFNQLKKEEKKLMITAKGLFDDLAAIDKDPKYTTDYARTSAKIEKLAKVILNCRTNTVKIMDKLGIPKEEPKKATPTALQA